MRQVTCLIGTLGLITLTGGCLQDSQYPTSGYSTGYTTGYGNPPLYTTGNSYSSGYYANPSYSSGYGRPVVYTTGNSYSPAYTTSAPRRTESSWNSTKRDYDHDGIPNRYDRDANGDGVSDRYQGR
jgi:hypothetical protein